MTGVEERKSLNPRIVGGEEEGGESEGRSSGIGSESPIHEPNFAAEDRTSSGA